jgi:putative Holliday junction resolvase
VNELRVQPRVLGVDLGEVRVGLAISDELGLLAHPLDTIPRADAANRIAQIAGQKNVCAVVLGVPRHMSGSSGESAQDALAFAEKLRPLVRCEVVTIDERLSTVAAHRALRDSGRKTRESRGYVDQVAAQMILQTYLDRQQQRP